MINDILSAFISLFGKNFNDIAVLFIVLLAVFWFVSYDVSGLGRIRKSLRCLKKEIDGYLGRGIENVNKLDKLANAKLHESLKSTWHVFFADFRHKSVKDRTPDINEYFTLEKIISIPARRKKAEVVPGVLLMVGILATFLSIASALPNLAGIIREGAGTAIPTAAGSTAQGGLAWFAGVVTAALGISVAAIFLSILFQLLDRHYYQSAVRELNDFLNLFSRKIPMVNSADASMAAGSVHSMVSAGEDAVSVRILIALTALNSAIEKFSAESMEAQSKGFSSISDAFMERLNITIGGQFENITTNTRKILDYQLKNDQSLFDLVDQLSKNAELQRSAHTETLATLEAIGNYQKHAEAMTETLAAGADMMEKSYSRLMESIESNNSAMVEMNDQRKALQEENNRYFDRMDGQITRLLDDLNVQLDAAFFRFSNLTEISFEKLKGTMKTAMDNVTDNMNTLVESMDGQSRDIYLYAKGLSEEVADLNNKLENSAKIFSDEMNKSVTKAFDTFDTGLSEICGRFGNVISDIGAAIDELPKVLEKAR